MAMEDSNVAPKNKSFEIILGSSSAARREILAEMGYEFSIMADALMIKLEATGKLKEMSRPTLLITADTVVVYQGTIREKPSNEREARQFITDYSGSSARVVGSVLVTNLVTGCRKGGWDSAEVYFLDIPEEVVDSLIEEGITFNVAGGLMLEHPLIFPLVDTVIGTADCVMGLSKTLTENLIRDAL
ncbi:uncharacterized protein LOC127258268 isoform X2 [Andrographis paniculata]|uniref:uncharacterized protein LOC127258268 isoform X2 n=1 Tax=Andrographis paniculata TaxID=175694 RepID=UPI0021E79413|nr:uncharacterized protein LOC127258268 isoform X2 [Andrographis paniculata]